MRLGPVTLLVALLSGCSDYALENQREPVTPAPELALSTDHIDFGSQADGVMTSKVLWLENVGSAAMSVLNISLDGSPAFTLTIPEKTDILQPGERLAVALHYTPINLNESASLSVLTTDPRYPTATVQLNGTGAYPKLSLSDNPLLMATASSEHNTEDVLTVFNSGSVDLVIENIILTGDGFSLVEEAMLPLLLEPNETHEVPIAFSNASSGTFHGQIWFEDNTVTGLSSGSILGANAVPVALCSASDATIAPIHGSTDWLGEESFDSAGGALVEYQWSLISRPNGSAVSLNATVGNANRYNFIPDLAGEYTAQLVVVNEDGIASEPCTTTIDAIPDQNLWVEMFWTHPDDDMDLHLLRPDGTLGEDSDCFYDNCVSGGLDWGEQSNDIDDPSLDIDDIHGIGPENINILVPEDGTFTVVVHDYQFSTPNYYEENTVTVNVFLGGQLTWTGSKPVSGENSYTRFVKVAWPEGTITEL